MTRTFASFNGLEVFFLACAIIGGFFIVFKLILQFIGGGADVGVEGEIGFDAEHVDSDVGFHLLSIHGLSAFFMMFGFVGIALYRQSEQGVIISIIGAVAAGIASVWVIGKLFQGAARLQSSGTLKITDAVGSTGTVYLKIQAGGTGLVTLNFRNRQRELEATEINGAEVLTGTPVRVVQVNAKLLVVEIIK